ncbi:arfGAP with SH3 domain, ANK repeat and PH domain-containing protein-like isoform X4 [Daphnia pulex]|uniref:arfGAP with SH3 domain, ANK repeat and PH domain-containing protein-like isoform X4 n=1 Tax=Daphnia pulex TaxID=6669 RepID=UPI001EDCC436|nr:arfGAP with SH3 domain, ANK repeat and PH domain-containing protein-like isoform X4 [Daphnia pulex]
MPGLISVSEFVEESREDVDSPTTSTFVSRMSQCRQTVAALEEILDVDREGLTKLKKAVKAMHASGNAHTDNENYLSRALERLGTTALSKDQEAEIGAAFIKFAVVTKELSALLRTLMQNCANIVQFPLDSLLKGDLRGARGDLKRPFDRACKDYDTKYGKLEKEKKAQAKEAGFIRSEITAAEVAEELDPERKMFQLQMCEYLLKVNEIKTKKGVELLQHLLEYYHAQHNYFQDGLKTIEHFGSYITDLSQGLQRIRQKQDEERKQLADLRQLLKSSHVFDKEQQQQPIVQSHAGGAGGNGGGMAGGIGGNVANNSGGGSNNGGGGGNNGGGGGYSRHQLQGNKQHGSSRTGFLLKKSEGKVRKVWQKRRCEVRADGFLSIYHADETKPPTRVNLLTCQIKPVPNHAEDRRCFDLISYNRTYHFQTEEEEEMAAWISVMVNSKEGALMKAFDDNGRHGPKVNQGFLELQQAIIRYVLRLPGNDRCADCCSQNDATWLSTNFGVIICIECSGVHREMGVHVSRIQSLVLDHVPTSQLLIARHMSNHSFNEIMEATLHISKPNLNSTMEERSEFIRAKYIDKKFAIKTSTDIRDLHSDVEHALNNKDIHQLLQAYVEGADFSKPFIDSNAGETALHMAIRRERGHSLHIVDFLVENASNLDATTVDGHTAVHYCALYNQPECLKLLLRSGANVVAETKDKRTAVDLAKEYGSTVCEDLIRQSTQNRKSQLENVSIDWNLSQDEAGSIDLSDEDMTVIENTVNGIPTPDRRVRSRPPSFAGRESPVQLRSRSSTSDSLRSGSSPNSGGGGGGGSGGNQSSRNAAFFPPAVTTGNGSGGSSVNTAAALMAGSGNSLSVLTNKKNNNSSSTTTTTTSSAAAAAAAAVTAANVGSLKKRAAPLPPPTSTNSSTFTRDSSQNTHSRNASDYGVSFPTQRMKPPSESHSQSRKSLVADYLDSTKTRTFHHSAAHLPGAKLVLPKGELPQLRKLHGSATSLASTTSSNRPRGPPPPTPANVSAVVNLSKPLNSRNGRSTESLSSAPSDGEFNDKPLPPARGRRCRALYDCEADNDDEVSFREGEILVVMIEKTEDENWMEGYVESDPKRRGVFPASFVHILNERD